METSKDHDKPLTTWVASIDGSITCAPKEMGGCGNCVLKLKRILPHNWTSNLEAKAEEVLRKLEVDQSISRPNHLTKGSKTVRRAAYRESSGDNFLYCPNSRDVVREEELLQFQMHWANGQPVIVRDVLEQTTGLSWEPMVMWRALCENLDSNDRSNMSEVKAIDCLAGCEVSPDISSGILICNFRLPSVFFIGSILLEIMCNHLDNLLKSTQTPCFMFLM